MSAEPDFGNWLRLHRVITLLGGGVLLTLVAAVVPSPWHWLAILVGLSIFATGLFLSYIYYTFHDRGGGLQRALWQLTLTHLEGYTSLSGDALDIGTGNGSLAVLSAMANARLRVMGVDLWAPEWAYTHKDCHQNAQRASVADRCTFKQASAHALPFTDDAFDCVMSHFVFHEVKAVADKRSLLTEALRVLRKGGVFSFHDMFFDPRLYGDHTHLIDTIKASGVEHVHLVDSRQLIQAPPLLMGKRSLGHCAIICGRK